MQKVGNKIQKRFNELSTTSVISELTEKESKELLELDNTIETSICPQHSIPAKCKTPEFLDKLYSFINETDVLINKLREERKQK